MANTTIKAAVKAASKPAAKVEEVKAAVAPAKVEAPKAAAEKKPAAKKATTAKKEAAPAAKKEAAVSAVVNFQFAGKSYTTEDLVKITKDVWKYDLGKKPADLKTVELYVKPEESLTYYVINGEITGSFAI